MAETAIDPEDAAHAALARGDPRGALSVLMRAYGREIFGFCQKLAPEPSAAEDLLQAVFIQAHQALPTYVRTSSLRAWLYGIARHRCLDLADSRRRWARVVEPVDDLPDIAAHAPGADVHVSNAQHRAALDDCLRGLPARIRDTLLLRFRAELSYDEMAEACGEKVGTLRVRVARALPLLRRCLQGKGVEP